LHLWAQDRACAHIRALKSTAHSARPGESRDPESQAKQISPGPGFCRDDSQVEIIELCESGRPLNSVILAASPGSHHFIARLHQSRDAKQIDTK
jgi:hypothetical protein